MTQPAVRATPRVLLAKPGLDGHDRGIIIVARALRDAGMEVIYTGLRASARAIARTAVVEDVDVVGLSVSGGGHLGMTEDVVAALDDELGEGNSGQIALMIGGNIPDRDVEALLALGVDRVFGQSEPLAAIVDFVHEHMKGRSGASAES